MEMKQIPFILYVLLFLLFFQSLSALYGGAALIIDPSGTLLYMPTALLKRSPFTNYLFPGLFLFLFMGVLPMVSVYGLIRRPASEVAEMINLYKNMHWALAFSYYTGIILIVWIDIEIILIREISMIHLVYSLTGVLIILASRWPSVQSYYVKHV